MDPQPAEQGAGLQVRHVDHQPSLWPEHSGALTDEGRVVLDMLEQVHDDDKIEGGVGVRQPLPGDLHHVGAHDTADRLHGGRVQIRRGPPPARLAQQQADHSVVATDVETPEPGRVTDHGRNGAVLHLLED